MYFPYLRSNQTAELALLEVRLSNLTIPILEPIRAERGSRNRRHWWKAIQADHRLAIIVNSAHGASGRAPPRMSVVCEAVDDMPPEHVFPALEIRRDLHADAVRKFSERFSDRTCVVIYRSLRWYDSEALRLLEPMRVLHAFIETDGRVNNRVMPAEGRILIRDGFQHRSPNAAYPDESGFDSPLYTNPPGFLGFGDFTIVGDRYQVGGGGAGQAALHITEVGDGKVSVHHFISDLDRYESTGRKILQAARDMARITGEPPMIGFDTTGVQKLLGLRHETNHATAKKWCVAHHLEVMDKALQNLGREALI